MDNFWKIDLNGVKFCKDILFPIGNKYITYMNDTQASDNKMENNGINGLYKFYIKIKRFKKIK